MIESLNQWRFLEKQGKFSKASFRWLYNFMSDILKFFNYFIYIISIVNLTTTSKPWCFFILKTGCFNDPFEGHIFGVILILWKPVESIFGSSDLSPRISWKPLLGIFLYNKICTWSLQPENVHCIGLTCNSWNRRLIVRWLLKLKRLWEVGMIMRVLTKQSRRTITFLK